MSPCVPRLTFQQQSLSKLHLVIAQHQLTYHTHIFQVQIGRVEIITCMVTSSKRLSRILIGTNTKPYTVMPVKGVPY